MEFLKNLFTGYKKLKGKKFKAASIDADLLNGKKLDVIDNPNNRRGSICSFNIPTTDSNGNPNTEYIVGMEIQADCCSWSTIRNICRVYTLNLVDLLNKNYNNKKAYDNNNFKYTCGATYNWNAPNGYALCGIERCFDTINARLVRSIRFLIADPINNVNHEAKFKLQTDPSNPNPESGVLATYNGNTLFTVLSGIDQCNSGENNRWSCTLPGYSCDNWGDYSCRQTIDGWLNSDFGFQSGNRVQSQIPTTVVWDYLPKYFIKNFTFTADNYCDSNAGIGNFLDITYFNPYGYYLKNLNPQSCCMNINEQGEYLNTTDQQICKILDYVKNGASWTSQCNTEMANYCKNNAIDTRCKDYCTDKNSNCDAILTSYCKNALTTKGINGIESDVNLSNTCSCFLGEDFYNNYYNSLFSTYPQLKNTSRARDVNCTYPTCSNGSSIPTFEYKHGQTCPSSVNCFTNVKVDNEGTINGNVSINQKNECSAYQPAPSTPPANPANNPVQPDNNPTVQPTNPVQNMLSKLDTKKKIIIIIVILIILGIIVFWDDINEALN